MLLNRVLIGLCLCGLLYSACGGGIAPPLPATYTSRDSSFRYKYWAWTKDCAYGSPANPNAPGPAGCEACETEDGAWVNLACFHYDGFTVVVGGEKVYFVGRTVISHTTKERPQENCLAARPGEVKQPEDKEIHGVVYKVFRRAAEDSRIEEEWVIYRTDHSGSCYQMTLWKSWTRLENVNPKKYKKAVEMGKNGMTRILEEPVNSFEFLK